MVGEQFHCQITSAPLTVRREVIQFIIIPPIIYFFNIKMKVFAIVCCIGLAQAGLVRRDAEPDASPDAAPDADADPGYAYARGAVSAPVCHSVPEKTCVPRQVETPRKVCHQEYDEILDTVVTQHCEEVVTTTCQQVSQTSHHTSAIVGQDSKVVATGVVATPAVTVAHGHPVAAGHGHAVVEHGHAVAAPVVRSHGHVGHYGKREADPAPAADADPEADPGYGYASSPVVSAPVCNSVPVKQCKDVPVSTPRKVAKTVCATHVDVTTIEDCKEIITTQCSQTSQKVATHSAVVGHDTKVGPAAVVATHGHVHGHPVAGHAVAAHPVVGHAVAGHAVAGHAVAGHAVAGHAHHG